MSYRVPEYTRIGGSHRQNGKLRSGTGYERLLKNRPKLSGQYSNSIWKATV